MAGPQSEKPLVFISASVQDNRWRSRLRNSLLRDFEEIECWDRSQLTSGEDWQRQVTRVLKRASLAIILLSPTYLESGGAAKYELEILGEYAKTNGLILFPILLEKIDWRYYPFLGRVQVWGSDKPLSHLNAEAIGVEFERIAAAIRELVSGSPKSEIENTEQPTKQQSLEPAAEFQFSNSAYRVIATAGDLALKSNRGHLTASCLLFALAGSLNSVTALSTSQFARNQFSEKGRYETEFEAFLKDGAPAAQSMVVSISGSPWRMSRNSYEIVRRAAEIAGIVNGTNVGVVHVRHLFAALIAPGVVGSRTVRERLKRMEVEESELCAEFRKFISRTVPSENASAWDTLLGTAPGSEADSQTPSPPNPLDYKRTYSAFIPDRASYGPRAPGELLDDSLNVRTYASHLAQVIAAKDTAMPLSIGLFGAWGSGKSHFIDLLDEQLNDLKQQPGNTFHKRIVPIRFNAWHYLDTNLWASLVSEIFDQLFAFLESPEAAEQAKLENLKKTLADQSALAAEAKAAVTKAQNVRKEAEQELRTAMLERIEHEGKVSTLLDDLTKLPIAGEVKKQLRDVSKALGLPKLERSFDELEARADEVRSLTGRIKALGLALFTGPGWWVRALLFIVALVSPLVVSWLALYGTPWVKDLLAGSSRTITQIVTVIAALSTWLAAQVKAGNSIVTKLESAYDQVAKVRAEREATDAAAKAQAALAEKKQAEEEARHTLREAEEKLKTIKAELAELAPGPQLMRFLRERATAEDYRRHLGLVSLVRQDFKQLSDLMTSASPKADKPNDLPVIDRIILYIDDLDRCRADRVIEVLEAVHLLLAFPLFAVVVAVDPRWLRQSLLDHYPRLLGGTEADGANGRTRSLGRPATPQDYLEKIFQVPFNLQAMEKTGYESLVDHLFSSNGSKAKEPEPSLTVSLAQPREPLPQTQQTEPITSEEISPLKPDTLKIGGERQQQSAEKQPPLPPADPERLVLTGKEIADVKLFQQFFQTPRALKRLANTYSLIRVGVAKNEWDDYLGTSSSRSGYRVPLLLLAVTSAFPALARPWLLWLRATPPAQWQIEDADLATLIANNTDTTASVEWQKLQHCLKTIKLDDWPSPDRDMLDHWVPKVARYSF